VRPVEVCEISPEDWQRTCVGKKSIRRRLISKIGVKFDTERGAQPLEIGKSTEDSDLTSVEQESEHEKRSGLPRLL